MSGSQNDYKLIRKTTIFFFLKNPTPNMWALFMAYVSHMVSAETIHNSARIG